jgi:hypothetical protein
MGCANDEALKELFIVTESLRERKKKTIVHFSQTPTRILVLVGQQVIRLSLVEFLVFRRSLTLFSVLLWCLSIVLVIGGLLCGARRLRQRVVVVYGAICLSPANSRRNLAILMAVVVFSGGFLSSPPTFGVF